MKKTASILLIIVLLLTLCSCGKKTDPKPAEPDPSAQPSAEPDPVPGTDPEGDGKETEEELLAAFLTDIRRSSPARSPSLRSARKTGKYAVPPGSRRASSCLEAPSLP